MDKQMLMQPVDAAELTAVDGGFPDIGGAFADGLKFLKDLVGATTKVIFNTCQQNCTFTNNIY